MTRIRGLRILVTLLLVLFALTTALATATHNFPRDGGVVLTLLLSVLALVSGELERWLSRSEASVREREDLEGARIKLLSDRARADVLGQVRRAWVRPALTGLLNQKGTFELRLVERPQAVSHPMGAVLRPRTSDELGSSRSIGAIFEELGYQIVILGEPGAGKTTLLMQLTELLLIEAEQLSTKPIPVVFQLAAWSVEKRMLATWIVDELHKRYGVPRRLSQSWVEGDQIILLLDGLDEVPDRNRNDCVLAINAFHDDHGLQPLVVTSRVAEYETLAAKLRLRGAVEIKPLSREEIKSYLEQAGPELSALRMLVRDDDQLEALLTVPLFLSLAVHAYTNAGPESVRKPSTPIDRRRTLIADFVNTMFSRPSTTALGRYTRQQTTRWLSWLAATMRDRGERLFYVDWIQPTWLPKPRQHRMPPFATALVAGAIAAALTGLVAAILTYDRSVTVKVIAAGVSAVPVGLLVGVLSYRSTIEPSDVLRWSRRAIPENLSRWALPGSAAFGVLFGLLGGTVFGLLAASKFPTARALLFGALAGLIFSACAGLIFGLLLVLASGLQPSGYVARPGPGVAIARSRRNGLIGGAVASVVTTLVLGLVIWLMVWLSSGLLVGLARGTFFAPTDLVVTGSVGTTKYRLVVGLLVTLGLGLPIGLLVGLVVGFQRGFGAYLRHLLTRWLLVADGATPRGFLEFLEYTCRLGLIRRRGGGYEFIHPLVLEHFGLADAPAVVGSGQQIQHDAKSTQIKSPVTQEPGKSRT